MMKHLGNPFCPQSSFVWDGRGFSPCLNNLIFGFGVNIATLIIILMLGFTTRNARPQNWTRVNASEKLLLRLLPVLGGCLSFMDFILILKKKTHGDFLLVYHEWLFKGSRFAVWALIIFCSSTTSFFCLVCDLVLCIWWPVKSILAILHLTSFSSLEVVGGLKESCIILLDAIFGIFINYIRIKRLSSKHGNGNSMEESLIYEETDIEQTCQTECVSNSFFFFFFIFYFLFQVLY